MQSNEQNGNHMDANAPEENTMTELLWLERMNRIHELLEQLKDCPENTTAESRTVRELRELGWKKYYRGM